MHQFREVLFNEKLDYPICRVMVGTSYSGKSTYATNLVKSDPNKWVRVCRDDIRQMLNPGYEDGNYEFDPKIESLVTAVCDRAIKSGINRKKNVVVDNTNLNPKSISDLIKLVEGMAGIEFVFFTPPTIPTVLMHHYYRRRKVPVEVVQKQIAQYETLMEFYLYNDQQPIRMRHKLPKTIPYNPSLPDCYLVDIDGTVAFKTHRGPYDFHRVYEDVAHEGVIDLLLKIHDSDPSIQLLGFTARPEQCAELTCNWCDNYGVPLDNILFKPDNFVGPGFMAKQEMYKEHIFEKYNVLGVFEDDTRVVRMWRELGIPVFQVSDGDFD